ncbi:MAG: GNAT family N-acetyltransferase [Candidatus Abyssobacteria bacterium SURF_17]|uniref:GNAT family N-acetyltransferase n=1 Tax=Candidatus Abyssobacteria bacterium SURF_17 TaxID=2093361 RepID=A0A419F4J2_9BACT|nr:MAG: GNAT family N-acetyltransferase [Candidatus Abyssubacteria bacterium SURF_17]
MMEIVPISREHYTRMAELHCRGYTDDFLPNFGPKFLIALYEGMFASNLAFGYVGLIGDELVGFCIFTPDTSRLFRSTLKRKFFKLGWYAGLGVLRRPSLFLRTLETFLYESRTELEDVKAEILPWVVDPKYRRKGLGTQIWDACEQAMKRMGIKEYKLVPAFEKEASHNFFIKRGYELKGEFTFYGKKWHLFLAKLKDD